MTVPADALPNRIREHHEARGLTLAELGERIGISKQLMGAIEREARPLTISRQRAIARELGVDMTDLLSSSDHPDVLSPEEKRLIFLFRTLEPDSQEKMLSISEVMVANLR